MPEGKSSLFIDDDTHAAITQLAKENNDTIQFTADRLLRDHPDVGEVLSKNYRFKEAVEMMDERYERV